MEVEVNTVNALPVTKGERMYVGKGTARYAFLPKLTGVGGVGKESYMWSKTAVTTLLLFGLLQGRSTAAGER